MQEKRNKNKKNEQFTDKQYEELFLLIHINYEKAKKVVDELDPKKISVEKLLRYAKSSSESTLIVIKKLIEKIEKIDISYNELVSLLDAYTIGFNTFISKLLIKYYLNELYIDILPKLVTYNNTALKETIETIFISKLKDLSINKKIYYLSELERGTCFYKLVYASIKRETNIKLVELIKIARKYGKNNFEILLLLLSEKVADDELTLDVIMKARSSKVSAIRDVAYILHKRLTKHKVLLTNILAYSDSKNKYVREIAQNLLLSYYAKDLSFSRIIKIAKDKTGAEEKKRLISLIKRYHTSHFNIQTLIRYQASKNKNIRIFTKEAIMKLDKSSLSHKLLFIYLDDEDSRIRSTIRYLLLNSDMILSDLLLISFCVDADDDISLDAANRLDKLSYSNISSYSEIYPYTLHHNNRVSAAAKKLIVRAPDINEATRKLISNIKK